MIDHTPQGGISEAPCRKPWQVKPTQLPLRLQMSKKNNQGTRRKQHAFDLQREAAVKKKAAAKAAAKQKLAAKPKDLKKGKKAKGIRIRKNVVVAVSLHPLIVLRFARSHTGPDLQGSRNVSMCQVMRRLLFTPQGIKVKDAASKRAALEAVKERRQVASMELDDQ